MSSGDFNYVTLRNIVPSRPDGSFIQNGYVFTIGPDSKQLWTNDLYLRYLSVSTIAVNSTLRLTNGSFFVFYASSLTGSTSITETLTVYSTIDTSTISGNNIFYSTTKGSTLTTSTLNVSTMYYSSLFGSSITTSTISGSTIYYSTLVGSTQATSSFFGSTIAFSTGTASTLFTHLFSASTSNTNNGFYSTLTGSSITTSTLSGSSIYFSTMAGSTLFYSTATGNILINNDFYGSTVNTKNGFYSTLTGSTLTTSTLNVSTLYYSSLFGSSITTSTFFGSTIAFSTGTASTLFTHIFSGSTVNINNGFFSTLTGSSITTSTLSASTLYYSTVVGSTLTTSLLILQSTMTGSTLNTINTTYSTLLGSTFTTNTGFWNSTLTGSTITTTRLNFSSMIGSTISTNTLHASTLITVSTGHLGIGMTNPTYNLQTNIFNSVNLSGNYIQSWINIFTGTDATAFTATYNGTISGPSGSPAAMSVLLGVYTNTVLTYTGNLVPGNAYTFSITAKMTGTNPYFYLCNHLTTSPADQQIPGSSSVNISGTYATYTVSFVAPSGKFGLSFVSQGGTTVSYYGFQIQGFFSQLTGGIGIGTTNPRYGIDAPLGSIQAYNLQQFEWINTQTSNTIGYNPASGAGLYKVATLGTTAAGFGMVNVRGQIGGFLGTGVMYVDLSIVTRGGLKVWGTVSGYQNSSGICDLVYSLNSSSKYDIYIYIKTTTTVVYDLMVSGASGSNVLYDPATAELLTLADVSSPQSLTAMANIFPSSNGYVGIGKTNPAYTLDVGGNLNVSGSVLINGTPLSGGGGGSSQWGTAGANIYYNTGYVGIGTVNPTTTLYVYGNSGTSIGTTIQNGSLGGNSYTTLSILNDTGLGCHLFLNSSGRTADGGAISMATLRNDAGILRLQAQGGFANPTYGITIIPSGNVGMGSSNPQATLDVAGTVQGQTAFQSSASVVFPTMGTLQAVYLGQYGAAAARGTSVRIGDIAGAAYYMATGSTNLTFYKDVSAGNPVSVMYFSGGSITGATPTVVVNNQLGVGIAPSYPLHVNQSSTTFTPTAYFTSPSSDTTLDLVNTASNGRSWRIGSGGAGSGAGAGNFYLYDSSALLTRLVVDLNGYVGIGTAAPSAAYMHVYQGSSNIAGIKLESSGTGLGSGIQMVNSSGRTFGIYSGSDSLLHISDTTAGADRIVINSTGSVGIGSASPAYTLDVVGAVRGTTGLFAGNGTGAVALNLLDAAAAAWQLTTGNNNLSINNNSASWTNRMTITQAGSVGIGSATPAYTLDVVGTARGTTGLVAGNGSGVVALNLLDTAAASWQFTTGGNNLSINNNSSNWTNRITITSAGRIGVGTATPGYAVDVVGSLNVTGSLLINGTPFSGGGGSWGSAGVNIYYDTGYVGIGTSSPFNLLHIYGTSSNRLLLEQSGTSASNYMSFKSNGTVYGYFGIEASDATAPFTNVTGYDMAIGTVPAKGFHIATTNAVRMTVTSGGNVGIGITNPAYLFQVSGRGTFGYIPGSKKGIVIDNEDAYGTTPCIQGVSSALGTNAISINPAGGNVGIGTINPAQTLHVYGTNPYFYLGATASNYNVAQISFNTVSAGNTSNYVGMQIYNGPPTLCFNGLGNVGIGLTNPVHPLVPYSNITLPTVTTSAIWPAQLAVCGNPAAQLFLKMGVYYTGGTGAYCAIQSTETYTGTEHVQNLSFQPLGGNVGIGTTGPTTLLTCYQASSGTTGIWAGRGYFGGDTAGIIVGEYNNIAQMGGHNKALTQWTKICINPEPTSFVGIGTNNPTAATLHVGGSIYASQDITALSDQRYKQNITPLSNCLDSVCSLTGYSYTRTDYKPGESQIGLIAQEVNNVFPQAVNYDTESDIYSLNYTALIAPLVQSIKELREQVNQLKARLG